MTNLIRYIEDNQIIADVVNKYLTRENDTYKLTETYDTTLYFYFSVEDIVKCDKFIREITGCQELDSPRFVYRWMFYGHAFNHEIYIPVTTRLNCNMETIFRYVKTGGMPIPKFKFKVGDMVIYLPWNRSGYRVVKQDIYFGSYCIYQSYPGGGCSDICGVSEEDLELMND